MDKFMTPKQFGVIADIIARDTDQEGDKIYKKDFVEHMAEFLENRSSEFDKSKFMNRCYKR